MQMNFVTKFLMINKNRNDDRNMGKHGCYFQNLGFLTSRWSRVEFLDVTHRNWEVCTEHICYMDCDWLPSSAYHAMCAATSRVYITYFYLVTPKYFLSFKANIAASFTPMNKILYIFYL